MAGGADLVIDNLGKAALYNKEEQQLNKINQQVASKLSDKQKIDKLTKEFEAVFLNTMLNILFEKVKLDPLSKESTKNDIYKQWYLKAVAEQISDSGKIGIAENLKKEMLKLQEAKNHE